MTTGTEEFESYADSQTEGAVIADLAARATHPHELTPGKVYVVVDVDGDHEVLNLNTDEYLPVRPLRKKGTVRAGTAESFIDYIGKHCITGETEVYAAVDATRGSLVGVINGHGAEEAGWGDHVVRLDLVASPEWKHWTSLDRKELTQRKFAEHIEDRITDVVEPAAAELLEIAQTLQAKTNVRFSQSTVLATGERQFEYKEDVEGTAGRAGRLQVPQAFAVALRPFMGCNAFKVEARFRFKIREGELPISYALNQPENVIETAFTEIVDNVTQQVDAPVFIGTPA